jgi:hypothetical protein
MKYMSFNTTKNLHWHSYPKEVPDVKLGSAKYYLTHNMEPNVFDKMRPVYRVVLYINDPENGFLGWYEGNEFWLKEFKWLDLEEIEPEE